jgi:hypothetical protein
MNEGIGLLIITLSLGLYLLPTFVCCTRAHHQTLAIIVLNIVGGWTGVGWLIALVWACTAVQSPQPPPERPTPQEKPPIDTSLQGFHEARGWPSH